MSSGSLSASVRELRVDLPLSNPSHEEVDGSNDSVSMFGHAAYFRSEVFSGDACKLRHQHQIFLTLDLDDGSEVLDRFFTKRGELHEGHYDSCFDSLRRSDRMSTR